MKKNRSQDHIYALFSQTDNTRSYFYIGRTESPSRRLKDHKYASKNGHESKYQHIRKLESLGIEWDMEVIKIVPPGEYEGDYERHYVIKYILDGHQLMNMKHGDAKKATIDELNVMIGAGVRTVDQVKQFRLKQEAAKNERKAAREQLKADRAAELRERVEREEALRVAQERLLAERRALVEARTLAWDTVPDGLKKIVVRRIHRGEVKNDSNGNAYVNMTIEYTDGTLRYSDAPSTLNDQLAALRATYSDRGRLAVKTIRFSRSWLPISVDEGIRVYGWPWDQTVARLAINFLRSQKSEEEWVVMETSYQYQAREVPAWSFVATRDEYLDVAVKEAA